LFPRSYFAFEYKRSFIGANDFTAEAARPTLERRDYIGDQ
jgi:hypothetical protein